AGTNDFFGGSMPGALNDPVRQMPQQAAAEAAARSENMPADYTDDEKRMQKKFKSSIAHARSLIEKGERMMKAAQGKNDKVYKKGKVIKEIGEKSLAELEASNPIPQKGQRLEPFAEKKAKKTADSSKVDEGIGNQ
ncbi:MAG TPA: hypothetical protein V6D17_24410, partial [Candidatus Obscuribacterales bacterium]